MPLPPPLLDQLDPIRAALHGAPNAVLPVVGSGLSRGLLSWTKLLEQLVAQADRPEDRADLLGDLGQDKYLEVASDVERLVHRARVSSAIERAYKRPQAARPPTYDLVARLPVTHFATTNYDPWLKDAVAAHLGQAPRVHTPEDPGAFADLASGSPPLVLMLHGDADRAATCVLSEAGYRRLSHFPAYRHALGALLATRSLLFIGHSLTDPDLRLVLDEWQEIFGSGAAPRHWFLGVGLSSRVQSRLLDRGVMPVEYGQAGDFSLLGPVLEYLGSPPGSVTTTATAVTTASAPVAPVAQAAPPVLLAGPGTVGSPVSTPPIGTSPAPAAAPVRWLHLSDLHLGSEDGYGHDIVLRALVTAFRDGGTLADRRPDLIFCTGDVAQSGKPEQYKAAAEVFDDLALATGVPRDRIFLVPGNHDLDRDRVPRSFALDLMDRDAADAFFGPAGADDRDIAFRRFAAYAAFQEARLGLPLTAARPYLLARCHAGAETFAVLGLNTAWLAHQDDAQGKLVAGERLVRQALDELAAEPATVRVALLHHPLDWLRDFERDAVKGLLFEGVEFVLHGHMHSQRPEVVRGPEGDAAVLAAGAAYQGRKWPNCALLVELGPSEARVEAIMFREHGRGIWMRDEILAPRHGGVFRIPRRGAARTA